jgi:hypothetical protein
VTGPLPPRDRLAVLDALRDLSTDYGAAADDRDGERFAALFVADGELLVPKFPDDLRPVVTRAGHEELRRIPDSLRIYDRTFHQVTNHRYVVDGDRATGEVYCVAHHASSAGVGYGTDLLWFIRYRDAYRNTDDGWRFVRRELHLQWVEEHAISPPGIAPAVRGPSA